MDLKLGRKDFQTILFLVFVDLTLTSIGITTNVGEELAPQFVYFTQNFLLMMGGIALYIVILLALNIILEGKVRNVLASVAAGMHFTGVMSWVTKFLAPSLALSSTNTDAIYGFIVLASLATALSYHLFEVKDWRY